jgi:signal transduction histidine kinase
MLQRGNDLALVAHELGGALTPVRNALDLVRAGAAGPLGGDAERLLEIAARGLGRADRVLQNLRALAAPESFEPGRESVALGTLLADLRREFAAEAASRQVQIGVESIPDETVPTDRVCLEQILVNLLSNALKFTPRGGRIRLQVGSATRAVLPGRLALLGGGFGIQPRFARVEVHDSGIGLSEEARRRLFEPFWRAPEARALGTAGMGLGLTVARRLVELLHGDLRVLPAADDPGSRFVVTLPGDVATLNLVAALDAAHRELAPKLASAPQALALVRRDAGSRRSKPTQRAASCALCFPRRRGCGSWRRIRGWCVRPPQCAN